MSPRVEAVPLLADAEMAPSNQCPFAGERGRLVFLLLCCNAVLYINRANMSVAVTFMFAQDQTAQRAQVLAAFYFGYPLAQIAAGQWSSRFGGKRVLLIAALIWSAATLLIIPARSLGVWAVCLARAAVGAAEGVNYPAQTALLSAWIPLEERSTAFSALTAGESVGTMGAMLGCAFLAHAAGWQAVFLLSSLLALVWACAFGRLAARSPEASERISPEELARIRQGRGDSDPHGALGWLAVPWGRMLRSQALLAIVVPHVCYNWGYFLCLSVLPDYFQTHFGVAYDEMGILTLLPYAALFVVDNVAGLLADRLLLQRWGAPLRLVRKIFTVVAMGSVGGFFLALRGCSTVGAATVLLTGAVGLGGFSFSGFQVNFLDISPRFAAQLMGISNTIASLPGIFGVMSLAWFHGDFRSVFAFAASLEFLGGAWYALLGKAEDQRYEHRDGLLEGTEGCRF